MDIDALKKVEGRLKELRQFATDNELDLSDGIQALESQLEALKQNLLDKLNPWQVVQIARHIQRPTSLDFINALFKDFLELHGDRTFADDPSIVGGLALFNQEPVVIIAHQKGKETNSNIYRNFGMPHPEGYRKALRLLRLAEKFHRPIFVFIDTPGAYPGIGAEERGQAEAIARNIRDMSRIKSPIIATVIGEGGSGGALAIGVADRILMLEHAIYSVISPEACSSILFKSPEQAQRAAGMLKLTANDLMGFGVIDAILPEPPGGAHNNPNQVFTGLKGLLEKYHQELKKFTPDQIIENRYQKFRAMGTFSE